MTACSELSDYEWLTGSEAGEILAELAGDNAPIHKLVDRLRGRFTSTRTHLLLEQAELRRRAAAKFSRADEMFFTRQGLEQATDEWVAVYKAKRFHKDECLRDSKLPVSGKKLAKSKNFPIADLCTGIGGDLIALAKVGTAIGIERDPVSVHFAAVNSGADVQAGDVATFDLREIAAFHIDPDRRPAGKRTVLLEYGEPNLATIDAFLARVPNAAIKLAPACEVPAHWSERCELEWISRDRQCRQLVAWHGAVSEFPAACRATILATTAASRVVHSPGLQTVHCPGLMRTITGHPKQPIAIARHVETFLFDIDPAVLAAKLKGVLAAEHNLRALSSGPTYLTGPREIDDPALTCFEVDEVMPFRERDIAGTLRARHIGQLEIKKRGVEIDPDQFRRSLKLRGTVSATLLITHINNRPAAILAHRIH